MKDLFELTKNEFLIIYSYLSEEEYQNTLDKLWEQLGDIPVDESETKIEKPFFYWGKNTNKEKIWHWFDERLVEGIGNRYFN